MFGCYVKRSFIKLVIFVDQQVLPVLLPRSQQVLNNKYYETMERSLSAKIRDFFSRICILCLYDLEKFKQYFSKNRYRFLSNDIMLLSKMNILLTQPLSSLDYKHPLTQHTCPQQLIYSTTLGHSLSTEGHSQRFRVFFIVQNLM